MTGRHRPSQPVRRPPPPTGWPISHRVIAVAVGLGAIVLPVVLIAENFALKATASPPLPTIVPKIDATASSAPGPLSPIFPSLTPEDPAPWTEEDGPLAIDPSTPLSEIPTEAPAPEVTDDSPAADTTTDAPPPVAETTGTGDPVIDETNAARADAGCEPLSVDPSLDGQAQTHSTAQELAGTMFHSAGPTDYTTWGENVAAGYEDTDSVTAAWLASPGHRDNMLNCTYTLAGVGESGGYWTLLLAAP